MIVVIICWVFFRAHSVDQAMEIINAMFKLNEVIFFLNEELQYRQHFITELLILIACRYIPETNEFISVRHDRKTVEKVICCFIMFLFAIYKMNAAPTEFLYFQF